MYALFNRMQNALINLYFEILKSALVQNLNFNLFCSEIILKFQSDESGGFKAFRWVSPSSSVPPSPSARSFTFSSQFGHPPENGGTNCNGTNKWTAREKEEEHQQSSKTKTTETVTLSSTTKVAAVSPPHSLSSSPSLTSLRNSLQFAADNPEKHSREQLQELEQRRLQVSRI